MGSVTMWQVALDLQQVLPAPLHDRACRELNSTSWRRKSPTGGQGAKVVELMQLGIEPCAFLRGGDDADGEFGGGACPGACKVMIPCEPSPKGATV